jgi:3-dehydroquinate dehydratase
MIDKNKLTEAAKQAQQTAADAINRRIDALPNKQEALDAVNSVTQKAKASFATLAGMVKDKIVR